MVNFSRRIIRKVCLGAMLLAASACLKGPGFMKQEASQQDNTTVEEQVIVATREVDGAVIAALDPNSTAIQLVQAPSTGEIAGTEVAFPPGSLAIATEVTIQEGAQLGDETTLAALDIGSGLTSSGASVSITSSESIDASQPFTVSLPLPATAGLVEADYNNLVVLYKVSKVSEGSDFYGVFPRDMLSIVDGKVKFETSFFGTFQAVITQTLVTVAVEKAADEVVAPKPVVRHRSYYARGFLSTSTGTDAPSQEDIRAWLPPLSPATVARGDSLLFNGLFSFETIEE